jgi:hypothetical protein
MKIFCIPGIDKTYKKLIKNNSYKHNLPKLLIDFLFDSDSPLDEVRKLGDLINKTEDIPFVKIRLGGRSRYRICCIFILKTDSLYIVYLYPKFGSQRRAVLNSEEKKTGYKLVHDSILKKEVLEVFLNKKDQIEFKVPGPPPGDKVLSETPSDILL